jgi:hypothetical protein
MAVDRDEVARQAAGVLAARYGSKLPVEVERQIATGGAGAKPDQYALAEVLAIAAFILECVKFGWEIYQNRTSDKEALKRTLRLELKAPAKLTISQRDEVIDVVVEQLGTG